MPLTVKVTLHQDDSTTNTTDTTTVKIIADWLDNTITTGLFGEDPTLPWAQHDDDASGTASSAKSSSFSTTIAVALDTIEKQQAFNSDPFMYAVIMHKHTIDEGSRFHHYYH